ncbi:MAG: hypothetical protein R3244_11315, partial [Thermoanaerobaculia bacterium]|nr:hypothetical protein [Thermoanaerobaculia bacterium]
GVSAPVEVEYTSLWVQDTIAMGNWTFNAGLRYDLQDGVNFAGTTGPSAAPDAFPSVTSTSAVDGGFEWEDITPRLGVTYALGAERDTLLRASFSQFPEALGVGDVMHLNPMSPDGGGAYAYFLFIDGDGDNLFDDGEFYTFLFGRGFDGQNPTSNLNTTDPGLDAEMTSELILGVEHSFLPEFVVGVNYTYRKIEDIKEFRDYVRAPGSSARGRIVTGCADPYSAATLASGVCGDYVFDTFVNGRVPLPDGTPAVATRWALNPGLETSGWSHLTNGSRERDYNGVAVTFNKRLANRWALRGFFNWGESEWDVPTSYHLTADPNDSQLGSDNDGALFMERSSGSGRGDIYLQSTWQWNLTGIYQIAPDRPWGFNVSGNLYGREGYPVPYDTRSTAADGIARNISVVGADLDRFRTDDVTTVDLRAEKTFAATSNVNLTFSIDLFNALNEAYILAREPTLTGGTADNVQDLLSARIWKLGVRVSWK